MEKWLDRLVPGGPWHDGLVEGARAGFTLLLGLVVYLALRWGVLRAMDALFRPLLARATREGETHVARLRTLEGLARSLATYVLLFLMVVTVRPLAVVATVVREPARPGPEGTEVFPDGVPGPEPSRRAA